MDNVSLPTSSQASADERREERGEERTGSERLSSDGEVDSSMKM